MSWSFIGNRGNTNSKVASGDLAHLPSVGLSAGSVAIAVAISDNLVAGGGATKTHAVLDFQGNLWSKVGEISNAAAAAAGLTLSLWASQLATALATTDPVKLCLTAAAAAKALGIYELGVNPGYTFEVAGVGTSEQDGSLAPSVSLNSLPDDQYLMIGVAARENDDLGIYVMDTDYVDRGKFGTTGGGAATNVSCVIGSRLAQLTGDTFAPTIQTASDVVSLLAAFREVPQVTYQTDVLTGVNKEQVYSKCSELFTHATALGIDIRKIERIPGPRVRLVVASPIRQDHIDHWQLTEV